MTFHSARLREEEVADHAVSRDEYNEKWVMMFCGKTHAILYGILFLYARIPTSILSICSLCARSHTLYIRVHLLVCTYLIACCRWIDRESPISD